MSFERKVDREKFKDLYKKWENRKIKINEAMEMLGIKTRSTWYSIARELGFR
ncbi:MAG: hypothetical protein ACRCZ9_06220 [Fusobacteriaceae bacterium]